jgi:hypothetical protein
LAALQKAGQRTLGFFHAFRKPRWIHSAPLSFGVGPLCLTAKTML